MTTKATNTKAASFKAEITRRCKKALDMMIAYDKAHNFTASPSDITEREKRYDTLKHDDYVNEMLALDMKPDFIDAFKSNYEPSNRNEYLAQYALDKVIRFVRACQSDNYKSGTHGIDEYSMTVIGNALVNNTESFPYTVAQHGIASGVRASLPENYVSRFMMKKQPSTAKTQVSSTTRALSAIGAAKIDASNKSATINKDHKLIRGIIAELEKNGAKIGDKFKSAKS